MAYECPAGCHRPLTDEWLRAAIELRQHHQGLDPEVVTQLMGASRQRDSTSVLTNREKDVLSLMAEGRRNDRRLLCVSEEAVEKHVTNIFSKLDPPVSQSDHRRVLAGLRYLET